MAAVQKYLLGSAATLISTELNSLVDYSSTATLAISSSTFNNTIGGGGGDGYTAGLFELNVSFASGSPTANKSISVWFLGTVDGTNYEAGGTSVLPARAPDLTFPLIAATPQRVIIQRRLPPGTFYVLVKNDGTGRSLASSGSTIKVLPFTAEIV